MKVLGHTVLFILAAGVGIGAGMLWRSHGVSEKTMLPEKMDQASVASVSNGAVGSSIGTTRRVNGVVRRDDSPLATQLSQDLSMSTGVTRWLHWMEALERATPADFPRLVQLAEKNSYALRLVAARWVETNPRSLFDHLAHAWKSGAGNSVGTLASTLFQEWPKRDLDAVIAVLNSTNGSAVPQNWRMQAASRIFDVDVERGLKVFAEWNVQNYSPSSTPVRKWAAADPLHAAEVALQIPAGYATLSVVETIGKEWAKSNPAQALSYAAGRTGEAAQHLTTTVLKEWASKDLNAAAEWLGSVEPATRARLSVPFVEIWAKSDASSALAWCEANLSGTRLSKAVGGVFKGAAATDVAAAADLVAQMNPSSARAEAANAVAQKWFPDPFTDKPIQPATVEWLRRLDGETIKRVLEDRQWSWAQTDPKGLAKFVSSLENDVVPAQTYSSIAAKLARNNPEEAVAWASATPESVRVDAVTGAFGQWKDYSPVEACEWLTSLSANDSLREPLMRWYLQSLVHDPHGAEHLTRLSGKDRQAAQRFIEGYNMAPERRAALLDAVK